MITVSQYFMGRDKTYASALNYAICKAGAETVERVNKVLTAFYAAHPFAYVRGVNSGWRPPALNAKVPGAAPLSKHMTGCAVDISDDDGQLDKWLMTDAGQKTLVEAGLWMEHPSATPRWCHLQTIPPRSGRRVFMP